MSGIEPGSTAQLADLIATTPLRPMMQGETKLDPRRFMEEGKEEISVIQDYQSDASVFKTFKEPEFSV